MCGLVTLFAYRPDASEINREELRVIRDAMTSRGPDGSGEWFSSGGRIGLGHRRLSIIDLSDRGAQPMVNEDRTIYLVFNGEIYNYKILRERLIQQGHTFRSHADSEVLIHLYEQKGEAMVQDLRGMFAFAIWDEKKKGLFLARDPFGIKPLYYTDDGNTIRVASQVNALLKGGSIDTSLEPAGHVGFFLWGHVPEPYTFYKGIRALPAGSSLWVDETGQHKLQNFCRVSDTLAETHEAALEMSHDIRATSRSSLQERLRSTLIDSIQHHLIADVPVGVFLSSGLDSTTLTALAAEETDKLSAITLGFKEYQATKDDETHLARNVAECYGIDHQTIWIDKKDFQADLHRFMMHMDQPTIDGLNTYFVSKAAAEIGLKVALSGLGGDELFGSYPSFSQVPRMVKTLGPLQAVPGLGKVFRQISVPLLKHFTSPKYAGILEYGSSYEAAYLLRRSLFMPWELPDLLDGEIVREGWKELQPLIRLEETHHRVKKAFLKISALEMTWYLRNQLLRDADWTGMAHSLEIRTPLIDVALLRNIAPLFWMDPLPTKLDLAQTPAKALPKKLLHRPKTGFSVPVSQWLPVEYKTPENNRGLRGWAKTVYKITRGGG
jgi:asparagine synthase (glutamine-hydrolysing)